MIPQNERAHGLKLPVASRVGAIAQGLNLGRGCVPPVGWRFTGSVTVATVQLMDAPPGLTAF